MHGGLGGRPMTHGRRSAALGRFQQVYQEGVDDPDALIDLSDTLALLDVNVQRCAERATESDTPEFRKRALELYREAQQATDPADAAKALRDLGALLKQGVAEDSAFTQLAKAAEQLAKRREAAWSVKLSAAQAINARDLTAIFGRLADIILEEAPNEGATRIIQRIDAEIMGSRPGTD